MRLESLKNEVQILSCLSHRNIVKYLGHHHDQENQNFNIFLEYIPGGSINVLLKKYGKFSEKLTQIYTRHILTGLEYLHSFGIVHRDIKGGNVLVENSGNCKLADFGGSKFLMKKDETSEPPFVGTLNWAAPEIVRGEDSGRFADIWSVGCTVLEMLTG